MRDGTVTWRLELPLTWGGRWDPAWLPTGDAESWRQVFATEDRAGAVFAAGGEGRTWKQLAGAVAPLSFVLEQYRMQLRAADEIAATCPVAADGHVATLVVPEDLQPPRCSGPSGSWQVCVLDGDGPAVIDTLGAMDLAEGSVAAERIGAPTRVCWAEPVGTRRATPILGPGWRPSTDRELRLRAFGTEEAVAALCSAAATGHTGPDVVGTALICQLGVAVHRMILEYRTLFRDVWTDLDACARTAQHDVDAAVLLSGNGGPGVRRWRHVVLADRGVRTVSEYGDRTAAVASVAAHRAVDDVRVRWVEPVGIADREP